MDCGKTCRLFRENPIPSLRHGGDGRLNVGFDGGFPGFGYHETEKLRDKPVDAGLHRDRVPGNRDE